MAHFKSSYNNYTLWDTVEYEIDQLIELPFENVLGIKDFEPKTLKIDGDNKFLKDVNSALEKGRKAGVAYESLTYDRIDYSTIKNEPTLIKESGIEYIPFFSTELSPDDVNSTSSFNRLNKLNIKSPHSEEETIMVAQNGYLQLSGSSLEQKIYVTSTPESSTSTFYFTTGSLLPIIHTVNYCIQNQINHADNSNIVGTTTGSSTSNPDTPINYWSFSPSGSGLPSYLDPSQTPFVIERGDEIRASYSGSEGRIIQDFTVTSVGSTDYSGANPFYEWFNGSLTTDTTSDTLEGIFDKIYVTPDPTTVGLSAGDSITSVTIRRRKQQDSKVLLQQTAPSGSNGVQNKSGGGFLIPTDLSETQKRNALTIINQLKGKNSFRNDDPTPPTL